MQDSTDFSPAERNFDRNLRIEEIKYICELAKRELEISSQRQNNYYNFFQVEVVYKKNYYLFNAANVFAIKIAPNYSGPYVVTNFISPTVVELIGVATPKKFIPALVKDLKEMSRAPYNHPLLLMELTTFHF
uniref:Uncharacterized protein n=1 Tax=Megaselia scalaris TaxID=36166 RepID=T1GVZ2_MEGSC